MSRAIPLFTVASLAAVMACGRPEVRPADGGGEPALRVASWNVHDLFDEVDRTEPPGDADTVLTPSEVESKLGRVAAVLLRVDADVVVLEEVESLPLLERLADGPLAPAAYRERRLVDGNDPRGIDVGVLSRVPIDAYVSHASEPDADGGWLWSRDLVEIHVQVGGRRVVVLGAHLVSRAGPNDARRAEQAARLREVADGLARDDPEALVAIAGDLNDEAASASLRPLLGDGTWVDLGAPFPAAESWTYGGAFRSRIDYLLVHHRSAACATRFETFGGGDVAVASDHRPIVADLWLP